MQAPVVPLASAAGGYYSTDPGQARAQSAYFGQSAYNDYSKNQSRRPGFY